MNTFSRRAARLFPLFIVPIGFAIAITGAKSAAELPPAPCKEDAMAQGTSLGKSAPHKAAMVSQKAVPRNLAILIFDNVQIIDYTGPYETFGHAYRDDGPAFNIYTVSEKAGPITTAMGMTVTPKYSFDRFLLSVKISRKGSSARETSE